MNIYGQDSTKNLITAHTTHTRQDVICSVFYYWK